LRFYSFFDGAKIEQKKIPSEKSAGKMRQTDKNCTFAV
jgi:hypothetical protein